MFLHPEHPSAKTPAAAFIFQAADGMLFVEANTNLAVQAMELLCADNCPADGLELLGVFRDYGTIGIRNDNLVGISYVEFLARIADKEKLAIIPMLKECIAASLTEDDREQMASIIKHMKSSNEDDENNEYNDDENNEDDEDDENPEIIDTRTQDKEQEKIRLMQALTGLGFQKKPVNAFITSINDRIGVDPIEKLIREGLRNLGV